MRVSRYVVVLLTGLGFVSGCDSGAATAVRELADAPARYLEGLRECQQAHQRHKDSECHITRSEANQPRSANPE